MRCHRKHPGREMHMTISNISRVMEFMSIAKLLISLVHSNPLKFQR